MARRTKLLEFEFDGHVVGFDMVKVDRSKLYGFKEVEVQDESGGECELATLADDGKSVIGKGGTGIGYLSADGRWCDKSELVPLNLEGEQIDPVGSSFGKPIPLGVQATIDEFLAHNIRLSYIMEAEQVPTSLTEKLESGAIFRFPYSYRGGLVADAGFLLMNTEKQIFFLVGDETSLEFVGLQQAAAVATEESEEEDDTDGGLMDFGMI